MDHINIEYSMFFRVWNKEQFAAAALAKAIEEGINPVEAAETYNVDNLTACAIMLIDPGSLPGCEIHDSAAEPSRDPG